VFAGNRPAQSNGFFENFFECFFDTLHFVMIPFVRQKRRVLIAVPEMAKRANAQFVLPGDSFDEANHF
jgi:hypothetical protein